MQKLIKIPNISLPSTEIFVNPSKIKSVGISENIITFYFGGNLSEVAHFRNSEERDAWIKLAEYNELLEFDQIDFEIDAK